MQKSEQHLASNRSIERSEKFTWPLNNKKLIASSQGGFTVIEVLVVITVFGVVGTMIGGIVVNALRGAKKTNTIAVVRQNGNAAIAQMARMIRYAEKLNTPDCKPVPQPTPPIPVSATEIEVISSFDQGVTTFRCTGTNIASISGSSSSIPLLDTNTVQIDNGACQFTCKQNIGGPPTITIEFTLRSLGTSTFAENQATVPFMTSITLRNVE